MLDMKGDLQKKDTDCCCLHVHYYGMCLPSGHNSSCRNYDKSKDSDEIIYPHLSHPVCGSRSLRAPS